jgi:hypothetical protein
MRCQAKTKLEIQCSRTIILDTNYCWQHQNYENKLYQIESPQGKDIKITESDKILDLERERLLNFDIKNSILSLSVNPKFKIPEIDNIINNYPISDLLNYKVINYLLTLFLRELNIDDSKYQIVFEFQVNYFYGSQSENKKDFYKYLFVYSLWTYVYDNTNIYDDSIFNKFQISKNSLDIQNIKYEGKCSDPEIFIRSNVPIVYPNRYYFTILDISYPSSNVGFWIRTGIYTYGFNEKLLNYFENKYKFVDSNLKTTEEINARYLKLFFQYTADPGLNTQVLMNKKIPSIEEFELMKKDIPIFNNSHEADMWIINSKLWLEKNIGIHIFAEEELSRYQNYSYAMINENCRSDNVISKENSIIIKSFNFSVPLETNITVHRIIKNYTAILSKLKIYKGEKNIEDYIITERSLMSTSLNYEEYFKIINKKSNNIVIIFTFYVTAGSCCIPTFIQGFEYELIFPPGIKYILYDRKIYNKKIVHYTGVIIT